LYLFINDIKLLEVLKRRWEMVSEYPIFVFEAQDNPFKPQYPIYDHQQGLQWEGFPKVIPIDRSWDRMLEPFIRFCCFVGVEDDQNNFVIGSGTLIRTDKSSTGYGILTAFHLYKRAKEGIWASFLIGGNRKTFELGRAAFKNEKQDFVIIETPYLNMNYFKPVKLGWDEGIPFEPEKIIMFGCPRGELGFLWGPLLIAWDEEQMFSANGIIDKGISGGGVFTIYNNEPYLWAIHSVLYPDGTLVSKMVRTRRKDKRD
jgi:hypothetical protein